MKKVFLILLCALPFLGNGQSNNVQSAANSLKYNEVGDAKKWIDLAAENEQTSNNPKMWYYRGKTYLAINTDKAWQNLDQDAAEKAAISFINCLKTDEKKLYEEESKKLVWVAGIAMYDKAIEWAQNKDYTRAMRYYSQIFNIIPLDTDNNLKRNNITVDVLDKNMAYTSIKAGDKATAKIHFQKLIDRNYNDPKIYLNMSRLHLEQNDTASALKYLEQGKALFDDNTSLITEEMNIYLAQGKTDVLIEKLTAAIETSPDNDLLYKNRGMMYESKKNYEKAAADYKKAIELNSDNLDANYNLGVMYFNEAAVMANAANSLKSNDDFTKAKEAFEKKFKEASPYLEESLRLNPNKTEDEQMMHKATLNSLKQLYVRTGEMEKYEKIKAQLEPK
ncbi:MAG: tetratricopeptide repeat protein [Bacteroidia bacterium]|nr:tetratricopeptide repeat protein [Bacteroidia bacterium]